ncbi:hypothetical protein PDIDSM_9027 [Penicillium digitatum]|nr:hypothetical protein PDIDSM_9027 [Penicillium digitatum]
MAGQSKPVLSPWGSAVAGATGAVLANALSPRSLVASNSNWSPGLQNFYWQRDAQAGYLLGQIGGTRQQTQPKGEKKGLIETGREVVESEDGWTGLWRGLKASLILVVNPAITYGAYQRLKEVLFPGKNNLKPWEAFLLGAMSKALATIVTQPLIVAKVGLQSRPPPSRNGKPFKTFGEVMKHIVDNEGLFSLFKGIGPQILKGLLVQGLLMMTKERMELLFIVLFAYLGKIKKNELRKAVDLAAGKAKTSLPATLK